jgi:Icc-related predicted phosphoesterase
MIVLSFPDVHGDWKTADQARDALGRADLVLLPGDVTNFGRADAAAEVLDAFGRHVPRILAVPGNCDYPEVGEVLSERGMNLEDGPVTVDGVAFVGVGASLPCPGLTPNEAPETRFAQALSEAAARLDGTAPFVLVVHQPPYGVRTDLVAAGAHVGSRSIRTFIEEKKPIAVFSGHIHEAVGVGHIGSVPVANPGPPRTGKYAFAEIREGVDTLEIRSFR